MIPSSPASTEPSAYAGVIVRDHPYDPLAAEAPVPPVVRRLRILAAFPNPQAGVCQHHLWEEPDGLRCVRPIGHAGGHVYLDSSGSSVDDRHSDGGHG